MADASTRTTPTYITIEDFRSRFLAPCEEHARLNLRVCKFRSALDSGSWITAPHLSSLQVPSVRAPNRPTIQHSPPWPTHASPVLCLFRHRTFARRLCHFPSARAASHLRQWKTAAERQLARRVTADALVSFGSAGGCQGEGARPPRDEGEALV
ncbi:hypothetical protein BC567DRAFT_235218 [Phyllosticta citribraziliensis]